MKILIIGGTGMLGHKVFQILRSQFPGTMATTLDEVRKPPFDQVPLLQGEDVISGVDVTDFDRLRGILSELRPDYIVNCVGIVKQRDESRLAIPSITINALLPHKLAEIAGQWGGRVIHPSTDCVFNGKRGNYGEEDLSDAEDLYGKSKFLGEINSQGNALTLRTSIIGRELVSHNSLLDWFLRQNGLSIQGFNRVIYSGVTTNQFARVVAFIVTQHPSLNGLYQLVSEPINKYDLLLMIRDAYKLNITIDPSDSEISDRSMKGDKLKAATGYVSPPWIQLVADLAKDQTPYDAWIGSLTSKG